MFPFGSSAHLARLDGALILVTGGARGIGAATARLFAQHGAHVLWATSTSTSPKRRHRRSPAPARCGWT